METPVVSWSNVSTYKRYQGKYIATPEFCDEQVIASGSTKQEAFEKALKQGYPSPVIVYIAQEMPEAIF